MALLSLSETSEITGLTLLEIWMYMVGSLIFSILLTLKMELFPAMAWSFVFSPLFIVSGLDAYFTLIVFFRQYFQSDQVLKVAAPRLLFVGFFILLVLASELLLCIKMTHESSFSYAVALSPVYLILFELFFRTCFMQCV
ncbi:Transmembrane protein [Trichinella zimbabwensis]|uniref:Transmembrane protein n=1 Tax=Trichinella zimbabwensis TaxID=268475 RepID=A0A0V1I4M2_9BILA|nr:Transmembrane protein [Trichinella zimbabwensis]